MGAWGNPQQAASEAKWLSRGIACHYVQPHKQRKDQALQEIHAYTTMGG